MIRRLVSKISMFGKKELGLAVAITGIFWLSDVPRNFVGGLYEQVTREGFAYSPVDEVRAENIFLMKYNSRDFEMKMRALYSRELESSGFKFMQ
jgi:hypothetical protein